MWRRGRIRDPDLGLPAFQAAHQTVCSQIFSIYVWLKYCSTETETVIHSDNDFATVAFLRIKGATLEPKSNAHLLAVVPPLLEEGFKMLEKTVVDSRKESPIEDDLPGPVVAPSHHPNIPFSTSRRMGPWIVVSNVQATKVTDMTIEEEVTQCFNVVSGTICVLLILTTSHNAQNN